MVSDEAYMALAIKMAEKGRHDTWKNPRVGAVIVKDDQILATGYHHHFGDQHAERDAISKLTSEQLFNSTLYVTLEPCNHFGKQPPCSRLIVARHVRRVVIACVDPHKLVTGKGIETLKKAGIQVTVGVLADQAAKLNPYYNFFYQNDRPWVTIKQAVTLDHKVGIADQRIRVTNQSVYERVHQERADYQAIMIGSDTAIIDDPTLLTSVASDYPPIRVVVDRRGRLCDHLQLKLLQAGSVETWLLTQSQELLAHRFPENVKAFELSGEKVSDVLEVLAKQALQSVYVEGGPTIQRAFLDEKLAVDMITYVSPHFLGKQGIDGVTPEDEISLDDTAIERLGDDIRVYGRISYV